eukprot:GHVP01056693.1.p1 GENE.GHVP01056693.1~~GHVP01056693.1.p1  ORF type:complete len:121 (+),score=20.99 GHVP01056693.1:28-390(+)
MEPSGFHPHIMHSHHLQGEVLDLIRKPEPHDDLPPDPSTSRSELNHDEESETPSTSYIVQPNPLKRNSYSPSSTGTSGPKRNRAEASTSKSADLRGQKPAFSDEFEKIEEIELDGQEQKK